LGLLYTLRRELLLIWEAAAKPGLHLFYTIGAGFACTDIVVSFAICSFIGKSELYRQRQ
jgi:hypothetical protein